MERYRDNGLAARVAAKGYAPANIIINAHGGRSIADGLCTVANDAANIASVDEVVLTLGINGEWFGPGAAPDDCHSPYTYLNSLIRSSTSGSEYSEAESRAIIAAMVTLIHGINPGAHIMWAELPDPYITGFNAALHSGTGYQIITTMAESADLYSSIPNAYLDSSYHPTAAYSGVLAQRLADWVASH